MPEYEICITHTATVEAPSVVGDAIRRVGPEVWRVEAVEGERATVRLWPNDEPYPGRIKEHGRMAGGAEPPRRLVLAER